MSWKTWDMLWKTIGGFLFKKWFGVTQMVPFLTMWFFRSPRNGPEISAHTLVSIVDKLWSFFIFWISVKLTTEYYIRRTTELARFKKGKVGASSRLVQVTNTCNWCCFTASGHHQLASSSLTPDRDWNQPLTKSWSSIRITSTRAKCQPPWFRHQIFSWKKEGTIHIQ
jgi:hypothetical protein